jgi:hypothetical protein
MLPLASDVEQMALPNSIANSKFLSAAIPWSLSTKKLQHPVARCTSGLWYDDPLDRNMKCVSTLKRKSEHQLKLHIEGKK